MVLIQINDSATFISAMSGWNLTQADTYVLTSDVSLIVSVLNSIAPSSNRSFHEFTSTFDGAGNTLTLIGGAIGGMQASLFMDLSGGTIKDFTFDISGCDIGTYGHGFLVGKTGPSPLPVNDYGTFLDINVNNLGSSIPEFGGYMVGGYFGYQNQASQTITISNCNFTGDISGGAHGGGLFGYRLFYDASGSLIISNCDISGNIGPEKAGGLAGDNCCGVATVFSSSTTIDITNCTFTGTVSSNRGGGLFGFGLFYGGAAGTINITDCDINGNITGPCPGGLAGQLSFYNNTVDASINITNCDFTGEVSGPDAGGLFGGHCFQGSAGDIIIQDCDISATVGSAGGLGGDNNFLAAASTMSADILNCTFTGDITGANGGGLFGRTCFISGDGNLTFQNCDISANITGNSAGGLLGSGAFNSSASTSTIDICNNTVSVNLQGAESGGLFGSQLMESTEATLNIENNTITVTGIDASNAGISVYESPFTNEDCTLSITNNTIRTTTAVPPSDFGGIFYVGSGTSLINPAGLGTLTITGNDLSGITFTSNPTSSVNYLFNEDGISFFDGTGTEIFATLTLNPNTYGPLTFDISNIVSWQAACEEWNVNQDTTYNHYRLIEDTSLNVLTLNGLAPGSNNFDTFTATFDGSGHTLTMDGSGSTDISNSLFMDLNGGIIQNFTFDISDCAQTDNNLGYLVGKDAILPYGSFYDISVNNLGSTAPDYGGFIGGIDFGRFLSLTKTIDISNCNFIGDVGGTAGGGLFGDSFGALAQGTINITNCDFTGESGGTGVGGLIGTQSFKSSKEDAKINILNCNVTGNVSGYKSGGLFGSELFQFGEGEITIQDCSINGNLTGGQTGGIVGGDYAGGGAFSSCRSDASINILNCNVTGNVTNSGSGGLFGSKLFQSGAGDITIQNCDISGNITGLNAGGLIGSQSFKSCTIDASINILNCNVTGNVTNSGNGGLIGSQLFQSGAGDITIQDCSINGIISGPNSGGIAGGGVNIGPFLQATSSATININNNTIDVGLQGTDSGGLFGSQLMDGSEATLNINNNTITITGINGSNAGISAYKSGGFTNNDCSVNIINNTIRTTTAVPASNFGGVFYVNSGTIPDANDGSGNLTITGNDLSGIIISGGAPTQNNYLFNTAGIPFFDTSLHNKIFLTNTLNPNTYGFSNNFDIFDITTWQAACKEWNVNQDTNIGSYRLVDDTSLNVLDLNALGDAGRYFGTFTSTFDGCGNRLTLDGTGSTNMSNSLFMDLSGGTIQGFTFDISGCTTTNSSFGFLVGIVGEDNYGNFLDISVNNLDSIIPLAGEGGYMVGEHFGYKTANNINITNCNFYGDLFSQNAGGLFGISLFEEASGNIVIENCDVSGHITAHAAGGIAGRYFGKLCTADASINVSNCTYRGNVGSATVEECGGLFGGSVFYQGAGDIVIENCDISGNIIGDYCGGVGGKICCYRSTASANITISNCDFTGDVEGERAGGLFGSDLFRESSGNLIIQNSELVGNVIGNNSGGMVGSPSFPTCRQPAIITITNCNFTGDVDAAYAGGLFGGGTTASDGLFNSGAGDITIQNCDISGIVSGESAGGIVGRYAFFGCTTDASINITNCNFIGDVSGQEAGGLFGEDLFHSGEGYITIQDCDISGTINGTQSGGIAGRYPFINARSTSTIDICNNTISVNLQGAESGGLFGSELMESAKATLNIKNNTITITGIDVSNAGISVYVESGMFINSDCSVNVINNTIQTTTSVASADFGGIFFVNSGTVPIIIAGKGTLTITGNDLSGIIISGGAPTQNNYLFNTAGIPFFDTSLHNKIFLTNTLNPNTYGFVNYFDIFNLTTWQAACEEWNVNQDTNIGSYRLIEDTSLNVLALNALADGSNNFDTFTSTFDGSGHTLTLDGTLSTDISNSLFMDLSGGTIQDFRFDISGCTTEAIQKGFLIGGPIQAPGANYSYGNLRDIDVYNLDSSLNASYGGYMAGQSFGMETKNTIEISNCNFIGNIDKIGVGGLCGADAFHTADASANITITNCDFSGNVNAGGGGLFGESLFRDGSGTLLIQNCDINGDISGDSGGGLAGRFVARNCGSDASVTIINCNFTGDVTSRYAGGLFGDSLGRDGAGNITIQNCDILGNIGDGTNNDGGGICGYLAFWDCPATAIITISNCNLIGHIHGGDPSTGGGYAGGLFGTFFFQNGAGTMLIQNCDITGNVIGIKSGGLLGYNSFTGAPGNITIQDCNFNGDVSGNAAGGLFGRGLLYNASADITIQNCDVSGNITGGSAGGMAGQHAFIYTASANINIINCNLTGNVSGLQAGGLFGDYLLQQGAAADITIQNCDIKGDISGGSAGGLGGEGAFYRTDASTNINITNCNFTGNIDGGGSGGLFGDHLLGLGSGDITIQNCSINGTISGQESGGIAGGLEDIGGAFYQSTASATINIKNNTIDVDLLGTNSGGLFGSQLMESSKATLNINNNTITITSAVAQTAGVSVYESSPPAFDNSNCTINITNNTIQTLLEVSGNEFGGVFYAHVGTGPIITDGCGNLTITGNNFNGINFGPDFYPEISYLFNTAGIPFFDTSVHSKIFLTNTLTPNVFPVPPVPPTPPSSRDFSGYSYLLQWIYTNALTALDEQTWFESYALYLPREQVMR